jgi:hypothetical protein
MCGFVQTFSAFLGRGIVRSHMSKTSLGDFGLGLLWLPAGFLFILLFVMGLFLLPRDSAPSHNLGSAQYHATES